MSEPRIHIFETGRLVGNATFYRGEGFASLLRRRSDYEFPAYCFVIEHDEGLIAIDTGMGPGIRSPRPRVQRRFVPDPTPLREIGPGMRGAGLDPADVSTVVLTHLDWDHTGGLKHFASADVLVHRPEREFASTLPGRLRFEPQTWPSTFRPVVYDLEPEPYGPFETSKALTADGAVKIVALPGHSIGQVGVIVRSGDLRFFFTADHTLRQDWFLEDYEQRRLVNLGAFHRKRAQDTSRRIHEFIGSVPTVLVPSHDSDAPARIRDAALAEIREAA